MNKACKIFSNFIFFRSGSEIPTQVPITEKIPRNIKSLSYFFALKIHC